MYRYAHIAVLAFLPEGLMSEPLGVDIELVLAVDASYSVSTVERDVQRVGYIAAFTDPRLLDAIAFGRHGRIAVTYVEWGDAQDQSVVIPWRIIDGYASAAALVRDLEAAPARNSGSTSISSALYFAQTLFSDNGFQGERQIIDISGDGMNTAGPPVSKARDALVAQGITINGLPLPMGAPGPVPLDAYFRDCVIGGTGALLFPVTSWRSFDESLLRKLVSEISGQPERVWQASSGHTDCLAGERKAREDYLSLLRKNTRDPERWMPSEEMWPLPDE